MSWHRDKHLLFINEKSFLKVLEEKISKIGPSQMGTACER